MGRLWYRSRASKDPTHPGTGIPTMRPGQSCANVPAMTFKLGILRRALLPIWAAVLPVLLPGCSVVGYPAGQPPGPSQAPAGVPSGSSGSTPSGSRSTGAGRTYEVFGVEYTVLGSAEGYMEDGVASWYGGEFHGRPTASGEVFDQDRISAAHRTLPLHTWVEVENLENGRRLVVRINDRGPFAHTEQRIIDLSRAGANELGFLGSGTARVRVRAIPDPSGEDARS